MIDPTHFPTLATARLRLREITLADAPALFDIFSDADVMRWFGIDPFTELEQAHHMIRTFAAWRVLDDPGTRWGIDAQNGAGLIGTCGLFRWNRQWRKCTIGYELAKHAQGAGYMREALTTMLNWGFANMGLHRIDAQIHPDNFASLKLAREFGFVQEGRLRDAGYWGGRHHDLLQFSLLRNEWCG